MSTSIAPDNRTNFSGRTARVLDASRTLAALAVVIGHARTALLVDPRSVVAPNIVSMAVYWLSGFGHEAVMIFFVLSGALVGGSVVTSVSSDTWNWRSYLIRRLSRLYIVLIPALLLIAVWDSAGIALFPGHGTYQDMLSAITIGSHTLVVHNRGLVAYLGNAVFVMTIYVPVFGSGAALWSLSNEFWYYLLFPCIVIAILQRRNSWRSLCHVVLTASILAFISRDIIEWMVVWLLGVVVVRMPRPRIPNLRASRFVVVSLVVFAVAMALVRSLLNTVSLGGDIVVATTFALFLYCVYCRDLSTPLAADIGRSSAAWKRLAGFSYTLYLFHQPPLAFANSWLVSTQHSRWQPSAPHIAVMLAAVLIVVMYSYAGSRVTEAHTDTLRRVLTHARAKASALQLEPSPVGADAALS